MIQCDALNCQGLTHAKPSMFSKSLELRVATVSPAVACRKQGNTGEDFGLRNGRSKHGCMRIFGKPVQHLHGWLRTHQLRKNVGVEQKAVAHHAPKSGAGRMAFLAGIGRGSSCRPANRRFTRSAKLTWLTCSGATVCCRICRTSCSMDQPWRAARKRKLLQVCVPMSPAPPAPT